MKRKLLVILGVLFLLINYLSADKVTKKMSWPILKGPYLGQKPPGLNSEIFAPGIISTEERNVYNSVFSCGGEEFYYTIRNTLKGNNKKGPSHYSLMFTKMVNGIWTRPIKLEIAGIYRVLDIALSPDGNRLYFHSNIPSGWSPKKGEIWYVKRSENGWTKPINAGKKINFPQGAAQPSFTMDGSIYFHSWCDDRSEGNYDIYFSKNSKGEFLDPVPLSNNVNSNHSEGNVFVAPDGSYILFFRWTGEKGLYISFRKQDGSWTRAKNTRPTTDLYGSLAALSHDGKYLLYSRGGKIYWVDAKTIEKLKPDDL